MKNIVSFTLSLLIWLSSIAGYAQNHYASIYIEGDQQTPFYVKVEGKMQPRLGQNHFIISNLDAGYTHFEILFQKNAFPPQEFLLEVPQGGSRGFVLRKVNDQQYALYDLQQRRYIASGNSREDDHAPAMPQLAEKADNTAISDGGNEATDNLPPFNPQERRRAKKQPDVSASGDRFLNNIELNADGDPVANEAENTPVPPATPPSGKRERRAREKGSTLSGLAAIPDDTDVSAKEPESETKAETGLPPVPNTDCPHAMDNDAFEDFALKMLDRTNDNERLKVLKKNASDHCFSTEQVRIIANNMSTQSARYEVVKLLYYHTSDQEHYGKLEALFNTPFLKEKFREIINNGTNGE